MPRKRKNVEKIYKIISRCLIAVLLLCATLYYLIIGETDAPGFSHGDVYTAQDMEVHFIDVGQGDCTLLLCGESAVLVDGGEAQYSYSVLQYLDNHGVDEIDLMVATHRHSDHIGGLVGVAQEIPVCRVLMNADNAFVDTDTRTEIEFLSVLETNDIPVDIARYGDVYAFDEMTLTVIWAGADGIENENEQGIVLHCQYGESSVLLTGDIGEETENALLAFDYDLQSDILKVAHHGSNYSSSYDFLRAVGPLFAVISCGYDNIYGHPGAETMGRLNRGVPYVLRTDTMGSIVFYCSADGKIDYSNGKDVS